MHSDILNYTKLAFNSLKNDSANQTGDDRPLIDEYVTHDRGQAENHHGFFVVAASRVAIVS